MSGRERLIVVSNRLPITVRPAGERISLEPSSGGLVSALVPVVRDSGGSWVGWTGTDYSEGLFRSVNDWQSCQDYNLEPVFLTRAETASYYRGFSNQIVWPLFHGLPSRCQFSSSYWKGYRSVNRKFAAAVERVSGAGDLIWVHDYHLMVLAEELRIRGLKQRLAYFHHIPFPPPEVFEALPWRSDVLRALMHFDLIGFQTQRDRRNFVASLKRCLADVHVSGIGDRLEVRSARQASSVGTYPISIDNADFAARAGEPGIAAAAKKIREDLSGAKVILGVDRLDYTKGIPERLNAFQTLLETDPERRGRLSLVQIVVPSREDIPEYAQLRLRIETLVSNINGQYGRPGWVPVHYFYRCISRAELIAFYRAAHVAVITPLKDGMNLVAKEFCASRIDDRGVLVLSEFAGAAEELRNGALLVNPHDTERMAAVIAAALSMNEAEQDVRMKALRGHIRVHDVFRWCQSITADCSNVHRAAGPVVAAAQTLG